MTQSDVRRHGGFNRDILEWNIPEEVLAVLLKDRSTERNLVWAADDYAKHGKGVGAVNVFRNETAVKSFPEQTYKSALCGTIDGTMALRIVGAKKGVPKHLISPADISTFNAQYPKLAVRYNESFHDRFLIIDDKELYLINAPKKREPRFEGEIRRRRTRRALKRPRASLKDLGSKCFAFTKLDAGEIRRIKKTAFATMKDNDLKGISRYG